MVSSKKNIIGIVLGFLIILFWIFIFFSQNSIKKPIGEEKIQEEEKMNIVFETGETEKQIKKEEFSFNCFLKQEDFNYPVAIIVDNFSEARPVAGINKAAVIYEAPVEADITRFMAIFSQSCLPDKIGPVRSARPYFAEWAQEYQTLFIHAGGSQEFLDKIALNEYQIYNLDEISYNGSYFWRDKERDQPHNLYISDDAILKFIKDKDLTKTAVPISSFIYQSELPEKNVDTNSVVSREIKINYREPVIWKFNDEIQAYQRFQNDLLFKDEEGEVITTNNLVILKTKIKVIDSIGHRSIETQGEGDALIFQKGNFIQGKWQKLSKNALTKFYDKNGQEIKFLPSSIWIEVVSLNHELSY